MLSEYAQRFPDVEGCSTGSYKGTLMGFISFSRKPQTVITIDEANLARLVEQLGDVRCGISQEMPLEEGLSCHSPGIGCSEDGAHRAGSGHAMVSAAPGCLPCRGVH